MKVPEEKLHELVEEISLFNEIDIRDIPCIDLYMDQVTTFFDDRLGHLKRDEKDSILTKTMINNYTKDKIIIPPKSKKYGKDHMILLILIYNLKQILSINDIKSLLMPLTKEIIANDNISLEEIYSAFIEIKKEELSSFHEDFENRFSSIKEKLLERNKEEYPKLELLLLVLSLITQAYSQKRLAEKIIDTYFNQPK
ncbi:DUF1836 domain-containing protein [Proteiniborus sp. MB09-C3]|uniref:DUF1836 domain-containing protein n=1 Tax=Proteiniborus sp. MB09-C3 TaxID=3050072 RepID=UPI0025561EB4|nr:DUF1836 domain-containing protein [Proteiniborus sp. MB09-C3]WIV11608.1 DUF1836 domain-containing protein [Proteiniborus sp. MB09-C3]